MEKLGVGGYRVVNRQGHGVGGIVRGPWGYAAP